MIFIFMISQFYNLGEIINSIYILIFIFVAYVLSLKQKNKNKMTDVFEDINKFATACDQRSKEITRCILILFEKKRMN